MKNLRSLGAAIFVASVLLCAQAHAATRVYLMRGLLELSPFSALVADLRARGAIVTVWSWASEGAVVQDVLAHRRDRIVVGGHSMGDQEAFAAGADLKARGLRVTVVGLDPLCTSPRATPGIPETNIWGNYCGLAKGTVAGARNIQISGPSHIGYPADAAVRRAFVRAALSK